MWSRRNYKLKALSGPAAVRLEREEKRGLSVKANAKTKSLAKPRGHEVEQICLRRDGIFFFHPLETRIC